MGWTADRVEMLKTLVAEGRSYSIIAGLIGGVSRNACIGKALRIGISNGKGRGGDNYVGNLEPKPPKQKRRDGSATRIYLSKQTGSRPTMIVDKYVEPAPLIDIPVAQRKQLIELTSKTCHWPVGDPTEPDFYFCGGDTDLPSQYCAYHYHISVVAPTARRAGKQWIPNRSSRR
jgi:GcrA cell cycle regulator